MLSIGRAKEAVAVYDEIFETAKKDPAFLGAAVAAEQRLLLLRLKKARALRKSHEFGDAQSLVDELMKARPNALDVLMERGYLLEDWAQADSTRWDESLKHWNWLATRLDRAAKKAPQYYECWYHVAYALWKKGKPDDKRKAIQTLKGVMILSPSVGSPEMKAKYQSLLKQMGS